MPFRAVRFLSLPLLVAVAVLQSGCRENTVIGSDLISSLDTVRFGYIGPEFGNDSLTILTRTVYDDSVITSGSNTGFAILHGLGAVTNDPFFGGTSASVYLQVVPNTTSSSFLADDVIDSAVVILPYSGFSFGDTTASAPLQHYTVHPVTDALSIDSTYYAFTKKAVNAGVLYGSTAIRPFAFRDSVSIWGVNRAPHLRIRLSGAATQALAAASANDSTFAGFIRQFPGIFITPDTTQGGATIPYIRLDGSLTDPYSRANILVYYHRESGGAVTEDSLTTSFGFNPVYTAHYNYITRNYTGRPAASVINVPDPNPLALLQNGPGAAVDVTLPFIKSLPAAIINKAELVITEVNHSDTYKPPTRIFVVGVNADGTLYSLADRVASASSSDNILFMDGNRRDVTINGIIYSQYVLNIPREVQQAIRSTERNELHLRVIGTSTFPGAYRLIAGSRNHPDPNFRLHFNIVYSRLP